MDQMNRCHHREILVRITDGDIDDGPVYLLNQAARPADDDRIGDHAQAADGYRIGQLAREMRCQFKFLDGIDINIKFC